MVNQFLNLSFNSSHRALYFIFFYFGLIESLKLNLA